MVSVSRVAINAEEVKSLLGEAEPGRQAGSLYRIVVKPDTQKISIYGEGRSLPAGMQVNAYALLETRQLYEWMLAPLYDVGRALRGT